MLRIEISAVTQSSHSGNLSGSAQLDEALAALGFRREVAVAPVSVAVSSVYGLYEDKHDKAIEGIAETPTPAVEQPVMPATTTEEPAPVQTKRERGKPRPGRLRRSADEVAEDDAADAADRVAAAAKTGPAEPQPMISTDPENRVEVDIPPPPAGKLTHEHVRAVYGEYINKFGMPRAIAEVPSLIGGKIADIPDDQAALGAAIDKIKGALTPTETPVAAAPAKVFTRDDVVAGAKAYVAKFGIEAAQADGPSIMGFSAIKTVPDDAAVFAKVVEAWAAAIETNPFDRKAVA